jgi:predicted nucleotidyltransferase
LIGASAANAQGARIATVDMDLWFEDATDPRIAEATNAAGGVWVSGTFGMRPPQIGGLAKADRFDVVTHAHGLDAFEQEFDRAKSIEIDGVMVKILPLKRIIVSKRAAGRPRDLAQIPALEEALAVLTEK